MLLVGKVRHSSKRASGIDRFESLVTRTAEGKGRPTSHSSNQAESQ